MAKSKEAAANEEAAEATDEESTSKKAPKPDGYVSPIAYAEHRSEQVGKFIRPQTIYGYIRNHGPDSDSDNPFPVEKNVDGHWMVNVEEADQWFADREAAKAAKKAEKAKKEKEASDKEAAAE